MIFEEGMTKIPANICASNNYTSYITNVSIPSTITEIGYRAFYNDVNLVISSVPEKVKTIGNSAFYKCTKIESMSIPKSITSIGDNAFEQCSSLQSINMAYNDTVEYTAGIGDYAFSGCTSLTEVNLSENVTYIGDYAFSGCTALSTLILPESLTGMGYYMIESTEISSITIPKNVSSCATSGYYNGPLANCKTLKEVIFEEGMTKIPSYICASASYNSYITKVVIPATVTEIGTNAFYKCDNMTIYGYINSYAQEYAAANDIPFIPVAIAKNATADEILKKIDLTKLVANIALGDTKIYGPEVNIGGQSFPIFTIDASANLKLGDNIQAKVDQENKTVQVLIGFNKFSGSATLDKETNSSNYWTESYAQVKSLYKGVAGQNASTDALYHGFQKLRGKLRKTPCSLGVNASASVAGYIELSYASGEISFSSGGIILEASIGSSIEYRLPPCPAAYVTFGLKADFSGKLKLERISETKFQPSMDANIALTATLGAGAGSKKAKTYVEIGMQGQVGMGVKLPADSLEDALSAQLSAYLYLDSKVFGFNGPSYGPQKFANYVLYPRNNQSINAFDGEDILEYDWNEAQVMSRDYQEESINTSLDTTQFSWSKSNLYPYNNALIESLDDGTKLMCWIDDNETKGDINRTTLMYSVYDGTKWSEEQSIAETGGSNEYPCIYSDGSKVTIVWQKAKEMKQDASLTDLLQTVDLYYVTYENGAMSKAQCINTSGNNTYEMMQKVAQCKDELSVIWVENTENDPFQASGTNKVKLAVKKGEKWEEEVIVSDEDIINNVDVDYVDGTRVVVYETSDEDSTIHVIMGSTRKEFQGSSAQIVNGMLYYSSQKDVVMYDILTDSSQKLGIGTLSDFVVTDNGENKAIYATMDNGYASELICYNYDKNTGSWSAGVTLTDYEKYIRSYSPILDSQGNAMIAVNLVDVNENAQQVYGNSTLAVLDTRNTVDLELLNNAYYDESLVHEKAKIPITFEVYNNSIQNISQYSAVLADEQGNVFQSTLIDCDLRAGESAQAQVLYTLPSKIKYHKISLTVNTGNDKNLENNKIDIGVGYADLAFENVHLSGNRSSAYLEGSILNQGYDNAENVVVNFYAGSQQEKPFESITLEELTANESSEFKIGIPQESMEVNPLATGNVICGVISSTAQELRYDNNETSYIIPQEEELKLAFTKSELKLSKGQQQELKIAYTDVVYEPEDVVWTVEDVTVASVTDGVITALGNGKTIIKAAVKGYQAVCELEVTEDIAVDAVYMKCSSMNLSLGSKASLTTKILPANATNQKLSWYTSDENIAEVSQTGEIIGKSVGTVTITAESQDGYKQAFCSVTVSQNENQIYTLSFEGGEGVTGEKPTDIKLTAGKIAVLPENPYVKSGMEFEGWSDGQAVYKAGAVYRVQYQNVTFTAQWKERTQEPILVQKLQTPEQLQLHIGEQKQLEVKILPENADDKTVAWESSDTSVVTVDNTGLLSAIKAGNVVITITAKDGSGISVQTKVEVIEKEVSVTPGAEVTITPSIKPELTETPEITITPTLKPTISVEPTISTEPTVSVEPTISTEPSQVLKPTKLPEPTAEVTQSIKVSATPAPLPKGTKWKDSAAKVEYTIDSSSEVVISKITTASGAVKIPDTVNYQGTTYKVVKIEANAFKNAKKITKVTLGKNITSIGSGAFSGCTKLKEITLGKNVETIGTKAFYRCTALTKVTIPSKVKKINKQAFYGCSKLKMVSFGSKLTTIEEQAFYKCTSLTKLTIPAKVNKIGKQAFYGCKNLKTITIKTTKLTSKTTGSKAFKGIHPKAVIKVPKSKVSSYKKLLKAKGIGGKVQVKK